jgi:hypothetical protein
MVGWLRTRMNAHVGDNGCVDHVPFQWYDCNKIKAKQPIYQI